MNEFVNENEKEIDIKFDALTAGIEHDGLRSKADINIIICYMVAKSKVRLTQKAVCETLVEGAIANYFEIMDAFSRIFRDKIVTEDEDGFLVPSAKCTDLIEYVEKDLPFTVREKSIKMSAKIAAKEIYAKENKVEIEEVKSGFDITLHLSDNGEDFMVIKLNVPSVEEAEMIKDNFLTDPSKIYNSLINALLF